MITLTKRLEKEAEGGGGRAEGGGGRARREEVSRVSVRDKLLVKEVQEMEENKPGHCRVKFEDPSRLHEFFITISPEEGWWQGGRFRFHVKVPALALALALTPALPQVPVEYNILPPSVTCLTRLWHPNISEDGQICLSLLRPHSVDGLGWAPTRWEGGGGVGRRREDGGGRREEKGGGGGGVR